MLRRSRDPHLATTRGPLRRHELLRLWAVCPPEKLPQLDAPLSQAAVFGDATGKRREKPGASRKHRDLAVNLAFHPEISLDLGLHE